MTAALGATAAAAAVLLTAAPAGAVNAAQTGLVSANPSDVTPQVMNGSIQSIVQIGNKMVAAGTFTTVRQTPTSADITRNRIFAFDATTGVIDATFNPNLNGSANSLDTDGTYVYVGGAFSTVNGVSRPRVAKLTAAGALVPGFAAPSAAVNEVVVRGTRLYIGGAFKTVGGAANPRAALAAYDTGTMALLPQVNVPFTGLYNGGATNIKRFDVSPDGTRLVAVGNFVTVGGVAHAQIAMVNTPAAGAATVASWNTNRFDAAHNSGCASVFDTFTRDVDFAPNGSFFAVTTTGAFGGGAGSGTLCDTTTRWETGSVGNDPSWTAYTGGDTTYGVAVTGAAIYVGGHMRWQNNPFQGDQAGPGAVPREGIAALDPVNGLPLSWNPGRARGVGAQAIYATPAGLWVGSDTSRIGRETHNRIAFLPLAGGTAIPAVAPSTLPNELFLAQSSPGTTLLRRPVDAAGSPTGPATTANATMDWSLVRGAFLVNGTVYYGLADGALYARTFNAATGALGAQRTVSLYDDPDDGARIPFAIGNLTGIFYDTALHRLYYTVLGDNRLFYRYFTPQSEVVGAQTFEAPATGLALADVRGMTLAGGRILYGSAADGALRSVPFAAGAVTGSPSVVSADGTWRYRAILVRSS